MALKRGDPPPQCPPLWKSKPSSFRTNDFGVPIESRPGGRAVGGRPVLRKQQPEMLVALGRVVPGIGGVAVGLPLVGQAHALHPLGGDEGRSGGVTRETFVLLTDEFHRLHPEGTPVRPPVGPFVRFRCHPGTGRPAPKPGAEAPDPTRTSGPPEQVQRPGQSQQGPVRSLGQGRSRRGQDEQPEQDPTNHLATSFAMTSTTDVTVTARQERLFLRTADRARSGPTVRDRPRTCGASGRR